MILAYYIRGPFFAKTIEMNSSQDTPWHGNIYPAISHCSCGRSSPKMSPKDPECMEYVPTRWAPTSVDGRNPAPVDR